MLNLPSKITYVDIASLLDLRQGYLTTQFKTFGNLDDYIVTSEYVERNQDKFPGVPEKGYEEAFKRGDKRLLKGSMITYLITLLIANLSDNEIIDKFNGESTLSKLWVNIHPFELSKEEKRLMRDYIFIRTGKKNFVEIVDIPTSDLTPSFIKNSNFSNAYIYDFTDWFDLHQTAITENPNQDCTFNFAPLYKVLPSDKDMKTVKEAGFEDPFSLFEFNLSLFIKIQFVPIAFYASYVVAKDYIDTYNKYMMEKMDKLSEETVIPEELLNEYSNATS